MKPDWYCDEVVPGKVEVEVLARTATTLATAQVVERHGGCQVFTNLGTEQHNKHLHWHIAVGDGVARFV